ncbi:MAG: ATP-binding protein [Candidatus Micrarchaeota archaeon]
MKVLGQIVSGEHGCILVRQKSTEELEIGTLLVSEDAGRKTILQVFDLLYGSQIPQETLELMSGLQLEGYADDAEFMEKELRAYVLAKVKALTVVRNGSAVAPKSLPAFFSGLREINESDLSFMQGGGELFVGKVRSGSKELNADVKLDAEKVLSHHVLIAASTGKGKSNLCKVMLNSLSKQSKCGVLVLDAHNEYHDALPQADYYSPMSVHGAKTLRFNVCVLKPSHVQGIMAFTDAQEEAMMTFYTHYGKDWITALFASDEARVKQLNIHEGTAAALKRRLSILLGVTEREGELTDEANALFTIKQGASLATVDEIVGELEQGKTVVLDTSRLGTEAELVTGSLIANSVFSKHKRIKNEGGEPKTVSIVLEEAPRVLSEGSGSNVFKSIAREGRKFKVGLVAITQLASLIPKEILANINTKIILGNEMKAEREALIDSAAQDLTTDSKAIASLDKGEAIVTSAFTKFAVPVRVPLFENEKKGTEKKAFVG